jgi:spore coat polysaccharide biosynthesis protein SpsF
MPVQDRPVLDHIVKRLRGTAPGHPLVVATSSDPSDDPIADHCRNRGIDCFRGSLDDVAGRFLTCVEQRGWTFATRINGDNFFADATTLQEMIAIASSGEYDLVTNVPGRTFPYGMSIEIVHVPFYRTIVEQLKTAEDREHVTLWLYQNPQVGRRYVYENRVCPEARGLQLALDTRADFDRLCRILARMERDPASYSLSEIVKLAALEA